MRSLVVYESWFGNTQRIAERIAACAAGGRSGRSRARSTTLPRRSRTSICSWSEPRRTFTGSPAGARVRRRWTQGAHGEPESASEASSPSCPMAPGTASEPPSTRARTCRPARRLRGEGHRSAAARPRLRARRRARELLRHGHSGAVGGRRARACDGMGDEARERGDEPDGMIRPCTTTRTVTRTEAATTLAASRSRSR